MAYKRVIKGEWPTVIRRLLGLCMKGALQSAPFAILLGLCMKPVVPVRPVTILAEDSQPALGLVYCLVLK